MQYICLLETCPNNIKNKTYCIACQELGVHKHRPFILIIDYLHDVQTQWQALQQEYVTIAPKVEASYHKYEPLIKYYEKELISSSVVSLGSERDQCISGDYLKFKAAKEEVTYCTQRIIDIF